MGSTKLHASPTYKGRVGSKNLFAKSKGWWVGGRSNRARNINFLEKVDKEIYKLEDTNAYVTIENAAYIFKSEAESEWESLDSSSSESVSNEGYFKGRNDTFENLHSGKGDHSVLCPRIDI